MTPEEATALWKEANPPPITVHDGDEEHVLSDEEYEAMAAERGPLLIMEEARYQSMAAATELDPQIIGAQPTLVEYSDALEQSAAAAPRPSESDTINPVVPGMLPLPDVQQMLSELMTLVNGLIE